MIKIDGQNMRVEIFWQFSTEDSSLSMRAQLMIFVIKFKRHETA